MMCNLNDIETLARTLYGEARGESRQGKIAVACVILNRVKLKKMCGWREIGGRKIATVAATCTRPYQFSCWNRNDPNRKIIIQVTTKNKIYAECLEIAQAVCDEIIEDITNGATHYYNPKACQQPTWAKGKSPCIAIGQHLFFNNID